MTKSFNKFEKPFLAYFWFTFLIFPQNLPLSYKQYLTGGKLEQIKVLQNIIIFENCTI